MLNNLVRLTQIGLMATAFAVLIASTAAAAIFPRQLADTEPLALPDTTQQLVQIQLRQVYNYFDERIHEAESIRDQKWRPDFSSPEAYQTSVSEHRMSCRRMLGLIDGPARVADAQAKDAAADELCRIQRITIPIADGLAARGLLFTPKGEDKFPLVIACPDATVCPEEFADVSGANQPAAWLAELLGRGAAVYAPQSIERLVDHHECNKINPRSRRQIVYRLGYIVGRSMPGLDVQDVMAAIDYFAEREDIDSQRIGMFGIGQGGMTTLYAAALDERVAAAGVADYFQNRNNCWAEPADRRLFGVLLEFGDAELAGLIAPRPLTIVHRTDEETPVESIVSETKRAARFYSGLSVRDRLVVETEPANGDVAARTASLVADHLGLPKRSRVLRQIEARVPDEEALAVRDLHFEERIRYLRGLVDASETLRKNRWRLTTGPPAEFEATKAAMLEDYRTLVGEAPTEGAPLRPRTKLALITDKYTLYHVMLDVTNGVEVYGQLLIPRTIKGRAAAVICQHGLNGIPDELTGLGRTEDTCYHEFGRRLAEHGYVVFAPLILHHYPVEQVDQQVRKATALGMMRLAMVVAKTQRVIDFLETLPFVDASRIGYYGLSYGGYSAIWSAPLVDRLSAIVCSGNFNDRRQKLTADWTPTSYFVLPYEDMYNWNVMNRFTHPELIAMTAPRPFCVEFAERDGITTPEWTATAWRQTVAIRDHLGLTDRIEMSHFDGVHEIHGIGTFDFLDRFLRPSRTVGRDYEYDLRRTSPSRHPILPLLGGDPCVQHRLDARPETRLRGRFWIPAGATQLHGMAIKLSRDGHPGPLEIRFGSAPGKDDLGIGSLTCDGVLPLFEYFETVRIKPQPVRAGQLAYYEIRAAEGRLPEDHYQVFGPLPLGGQDWPASFGLAYRVLTDRPQDASESGDEQPTFHHIKQMCQPYHTDDPAKRLRGKPAGRGETKIDESWVIRRTPDSDEVVTTAAADLQEFFAKRAGISVRVVGRMTEARGKAVDLAVSQDPERLGAINTEEGYRIEVKPDAVRIIGRTPRGVMRGVYYLEELMRLRDAPCLRHGTTDRNCKFRRRISCIGGIIELGFSETSHPIAYSDGILQRLSHHGFNAIWISVNVEEAVLDSRVFPELNDPHTARRFERFRDLVDRARRFGIDVLVYYVCNYLRPVPESFYKNYPDCQGVGWGRAMCTSHPDVRRFLQETTRKMFASVPGLKGAIVIFDSEGFHHCGLRQRDQCPRCKDRKPDDIAAELLDCLHRGMKAGNPDGEMIAWSYYTYDPLWVDDVIGKLPEGVIFQAGFSKGTLIERGGVRSNTPDYNITSIGPPERFVRQYAIAKQHGVKVIAKTESAASQEFLCVPYVPCMGQWHQRMAKISEYELDGIWGTYNHYGYTPARPVDIMLWYSWTGAPDFESLLDQIITRDFGARTAPYVKRAWEHVTRAIRNYPYSNWVSRSAGGPIQKGPSQPLWLGPGVKARSPWRAWQNNLDWTKPWGPKVVEDCFRMMEDEMAAACAQLRQARGAAEPHKAAELDAETRVIEMMQRSLHTMLNLIRWIPVRDAYNNSISADDREHLRKQLVAICRDELANARKGLELAKADSRFGAVGQPAGSRRGGLYNAPLIRYKIGQVEDVLFRQLLTADELKRE